MAITFPVSFPSSPQPRITRFTPQSSVAITISDQSFVRQTQVNDGQQWIIEAQWDPMVRASAAAFVATLTSLNGGEGTFNFGPFAANYTMRGEGGGSPKIKGASQTGQDIITDGWPDSETNVVLPGDYIAFDNHLYQVLIASNSNASNGAATLTLWPDVKTAPSDNAVITTSQPKGRFYLVSASEWTVDEVGRYGLTVVGASVI